MTLSSKLINHLDFSRYLWEETGCGIRRLFEFTAPFRAIKIYQIILSPHLNQKTREKSDQSFWGFGQEEGELLLISQLSAKIQGYSRSIIKILILETKSPLPSNPLVLEDFDRKRSLLGWVKVLPKVI